MTACSIEVPLLGWSVRLSQSLRGPQWDGLTWFSLGVGTVSVSLTVPGRFHTSMPVWLYNAFRRVYADARENCWGFGLLQIGGRHLVFIGENSEGGKVDLLFLHLLRWGGRR